MAWNSNDYQFAQVQCGHTYITVAIPKTRQLKTSEIPMEPTTYTAIAATPMKETAKAYLIEIANEEDGEITEHWIPKSTVLALNTQAGTMEIADWKLRQIGIIE